MANWEIEHNNLFGGAKKHATFRNNSCCFTGRISLTAACSGSSRRYAWCHLVVPGEGVMHAAKVKDLPCEESGGRERITPSALLSCTTHTTQASLFSLSTFHTSTMAWFLWFCVQTPRSLCEDGVYIACQARLREAPCALLHSQQGLSPARLSGQ